MGDEPIMNYLRCLGGKYPELWDKNSNEALDEMSVVFKRTQPMLVIAYLDNQGQSTRLDIANLFWPDIEDKHKRLARLSEVLRIIENAVPSTIVKSSDNKFIHTNVKSDFEELKQAYESENYEAVIDIYRGHYLQGLEQHKGLKIFDNPELYDWILKQRESVLDVVRNSLLNYGEVKAAQEDFSSAATLAKRAYKLNTEQSYILAENYQRIYTLLTASKSADATSIAKEAIKHYGKEDISFFDSFQEARAQLTTPHNLPQLETIIGREQDLSVCTNLLLDFNQNAHDVRLLTLFGPAGIGKTTFAKELSRKLRGYKTFQDGIYAVWLEELSNPKDVIEKVAQVLGLQIPATRPVIDFVADMIGQKSMLLYLDNFEHLIEATADVDVLLENCPNVKILVSTREVLPSDWSQLYSLEGLAFPEEANDLRDASSALDYAAVKLFVNQGKKANRSLELTKDNVASIVTICQQVKGLPLALKLAASWLRASTPKVIVDELRDGIELLDDVEVSWGNPSSGSQRGLSASLDLSWERLSKTEQVAFSKLVVFQGGFTLQAAKDIAGLKLSLLKALQQKSLIEWDAEKERYSLHPLIRSYGKAKCGASDLEALRAQHSSYYLKLLRMITDGTQEERNRAVRVLKPEIYNIQNAWQVAVDKAELDELKNSAQAVQRLFDEIAMCPLGIYLLKIAINKLSENNETHQVVLSSLLANQAWLLLRLGNYPTGIEIANNALKFCDDNFYAKSTAINVLTGCHKALRNFDTARKFHHDGLKHTKNHPTYYASVLSNIGNLELDCGNFDLAEKYYLQALDIRRCYNQESRLPHLLNGLGEIFFHRQEFEKSKKQFETALDFAKRLELGHWIISIQSNYYYLLFCMNPNDNFEEQFKTLKRQAENTGNAWSSVSISLNLFRYLVAQKNYSEALNIIDESIDKQSQSDTPFAIFETLICLLKISTVCNMEISSLLYKELYKPSIQQKFKHKEKVAFESLNFELKSRENLTEDIQDRLRQLFEKAERWVQPHLSL